MYHPLGRIHKKSVAFGASLFIHDSLLFSMADCEPSDILELLLSEIRFCTSQFSWYSGIVGLTSKLDRLKAMAASQQFLDWWEHGRPLDASSHEVKRFKNHPSLDRHADWASTEWDRLHRLGKVEFFPPGQPKPPNLHINPCALLLKERAGASEELPDIERYKA